MKKYLAAFLLLLIVLTGCEPRIEDNILDIVITPSVSTVEVGDDFSLTVSSEGRTLGGLGWSFDETYLSLIEENGSDLYLKALKAGTVSISVVDEATGKTSSITIEITDLIKEPEPEPEPSPEIKPEVPEPQPEGMPEEPETEVPETEVPETEVPETEVPEVPADQVKQGVYEFKVNDMQVYELGSADDMKKLDSVILRFTMDDGTTFQKMLFYLSSSMEWKEYGADGRQPSPTEDYSHVSSVSGMYVPSDLYEIDPDDTWKIRLSGQQLAGTYWPGEGDILYSDGIIDKVNGTVSFDFKREHATLNIKTHPGMRIRINITDFSAPEAGLNPEVEKGSYSETILTKSKGNVVVNGTWNEESRMQIIYVKYGRMHEVDIPLPEFKAGEVFDIDAMFQLPEIEIKESFVQAKNINGYDIENGPYKYEFPGTINQGQLNLCWAAASSQMLQWWLWRNSLKMEGERFIPSVEIPFQDYPDRDDYSDGSFSIFMNVFNTNWLNEGGLPAIAIRWFLSGETNPYAEGQLKSNGYRDGGYFRDVPHVTDLLWTWEDNSDFPGYKSNPEVGMERYREISKEIYANLDAGRPLTIEQDDHAFMIWGASFDKDTGLLTSLRVTDSNGGYSYSGPHTGAYNIGHVDIEYIDGKLMMSNPYYGRSGGELLRLNTLLESFQGIEYITD